MISYILSFIPLVGTSVGAILGINNKLYNRLKDPETTLVAVATGILGSISFTLFAEAKEKVRYPILFIGILTGLIFILLMEYCANHTKITVKSKLFWAMLIHNIPEGIVVGIALADSNMIRTAILLLCSISLQNIPDGLAVSMPLLSSQGRKKAFMLGIISGIVEPIAAIFIIISSQNTNIQLIDPFLIGFSLSTIVMITVELLKDCEKKKIALYATIFTTVFNSILGSILG